MHIPELDLEPEVDVLLATREVVEKLEQCVMNWQTQITVVIEEQQRKKPQVCNLFKFYVMFHHRTQLCETLI